MEFKLTCGACKRRYSGQQISAACPQCGWSPVGFEEVAVKGKPPAPALSNKQRLRRAAKRAQTSREPEARSLLRPRTLVGVLERRLHGLVLVAQGLEQKVELDTDVPPHLLTGYQTVFDIVSERPLVLRPRRTPQIQAAQAADARQARDEALATRRQHDKYGPRPVGTSELELLKRPQDQIRRIVELTKLRNDPAAWSILANGMRIRAVTKPIESAILQIGWKKIATHAATYPGDWPTELTDFLERQREIEAARPMVSEGFLDDAYSDPWGYGMADG